MPKKKTRPRASKKPAAKAPTGPLRPADVLIVGLGASAGGLAALEQFFRERPARPRPGLRGGAAPRPRPRQRPRPSSCSAVSRLPVVEVTDGMAVRADAVYVIPPNREMEVFDGALLLAVPSAPRGQRMAVDGFFRSLADERGSDAIGVVLSGHRLRRRARPARHPRRGRPLLRAGAGHRQVRRHAARPRCAPSPCQPRSLPPSSCPALLASALGAARLRARHPAPARGRRRRARHASWRLLRSATGRDFSQYKRSSVVRRVERRMAANGIEDIDALCPLPARAPRRGAPTLFQELLINVTSFFRDPEAFDALQAEVLRKARRREGRGRARAGVGRRAARRGEEAYSIAILLREAMDAGAQPARRCRSTAPTSTSPPSPLRGPASTRRHRRGRLPRAAAPLLRRGGRGLPGAEGDPRAGGLRGPGSSSRIRPSPGWTCVSCRNVLHLHGAGAAGRGCSRCSTTRSDRAGRCSCRRREGSASQTRAVRPRRPEVEDLPGAAQACASRARRPDQRPLLGEDAPPAVTVEGPATPSDFAERRRRVLLQHFAPAAVRDRPAGATSSTCTVRPGPTCARPRASPRSAWSRWRGRGCSSSSARRSAQAATKGRPVHRAGRAVSRDGATRDRGPDACARARAQGRPGLLLVTLPGAPAALRPPRPCEAKAPRARRRRPPHPRSWTRELAYTRESLQATIEEQQTSHEELQSTNEELQSTNEEVQASNEELETAKEELQSVNEELTTVNAELQAKVEQLSGMQDDMKNLLDASSVGTVFLDERLNIRRFTREASRIYRLAPSDVGPPPGRHQVQPRRARSPRRRAGGARHAGADGAGGALRGRRLVPGARCCPTGQRTTRSAAWC